MRLPKDLLSDTYKTPKVILCQTNKDKICQLDVNDLNGTFKFNGYSEISFNVPSIYHDLITGEQKRTPYYNYIEGLRLVYLEGFGYFQLQDPELYSDGIQEYKQLNAYSLEYSLSQRYLETFIINMGDTGDTVGSIDGVILYNPTDAEHSLLHLILKKAYGWTIGHVDAELASQGRSFEVDRESIYDFIMNEMCDTFKCYVEFDTINNIINVYSENEIERFIGDGTTTTFKLSGDFSDTSTVTINGHIITQYTYNQETNDLLLSIAPAQGDIVEITNDFKSKYDTDVIVAFENLSNEMHVNYSADDIKTVLTVKGADDLDIRSVNFGLPSIMNLDYYCTPEWMGDKLYYEYLAYMDKQDKYMGGFYSKDISGSTEEVFDISPIKQDFVVGHTQKFIANGDASSLSVDSENTIMDIDKISIEFDIESEIEEFDIESESQQFNQPEILSETFTANAQENTFTLINEIVVLEDTKVYIEDELISNDQYTYDEATKELTIVAPMSDGDTIKVETPKAALSTRFSLKNPSNKIVVVKINGEIIDSSKYQINGSYLLFTDTSILQYEDTIVIELINNKFTLQNLRDQIVSVKINGKETNAYQLQNALLTINSALNDGDVVSVESIDTHFDVSSHKDKSLVSVYINQNEVPQSGYSLDINTYVLTINNQNITAGNKVTINMVNNVFTIPQKKDRLLSVSIDFEEIPNNIYSFDESTMKLTISSLPTLFAGEAIEVVSIDTSFQIDMDRKKITSVIIDGVAIKEDGYNYINNKLTITSPLLMSDSNIIVNFVENYFNITSFTGKIESIAIGDNKITEYEFDSGNNILIINDDSLTVGSTIQINTIQTTFQLPEFINWNPTSVAINGTKTNKYTFKSGALTISDALKFTDIVSVEFIDNHFTLLNEIGLRHIVEKRNAGSLEFETLAEGPDGYEYNSETCILTIYVPLNNGDRIRVKTIDSVDALLIVNSNPQAGEILIDDVTPVLKSYTPKIGDYVIKVESYTEVLKELYRLIDNRLTEENSVPDEYKITEIKLNPDNYDQADMFLPEADIEHLGEVYKIVNQDKVEEDGNVTYNDIACKYYVCEMKMSVQVDEDGHEENKYTYVWNERDLVFGSDGINSLKEKIDIYSSINDVQIAAEWDQKPKDSEEYKSYIDNLNKLQDAKKQLEEKQNMVDGIAEQIQKVREKIQFISEDIDISKNFSPDSLDRLSLFLREDEYTDDCFCTTDIDTDLDIINTQKELLVAGSKKLKAISKPTLSFSASMKNIYAMPEFEPILHQFSLGNFIRVMIRKDFIKKARLLEVQLNFNDLSNFSCTFGDLLSVKDQGDIHADLLAQAVNAGKSVASGSSYWQKGYDIATAIDEKIRQGLIDATTSIRSSSAGQDVSWDNYGIHLRKMVDGVLDKHEGWITNNKFLYSDDNFKTTKSVFGSYTIEGETYWGVLAGCVSAGLIEGSSIIGGEICIGLQDDGTYAFKVAKDGTVTMNKGDAAEKLSYFSFDGDNGLIVGENKNKEYFSRVSAQRIEFCRKARIKTVTSEPTYKADNYYDYILYEHNDNGVMYYDYYKNPDFIYKVESPFYEARAINENFVDPKIKFGVTITYFANDTAYMKKAEVEGDIKVGTKSSTPSISLGGKFKIQIESNGSLSIVAT